MAFDYKKEYKEFYLPKNKPQVVTVPPMNYVGVYGAGDPKEPNGAYQKAMNILYTISYTLKMSYKGDHHIPGFFEYVVPPLEGFWWQPNLQNMDITDKSSFNWLSVIRLPDFISETDLAWAIGEAANKKKLDCSPAKLLTVNEGLCAQIMHIGPYDNEPATLQLINAYLAEHGYQNDITPSRRHHEIYLSDPRRTAPEKLKTVIRIPIKQITQE